MSLLRSKIRPPDLPPGTIDRPRLLDRILERERALVVLQAPAGCGKSVLAIQAYRKAPRRTAWLFLEAEDAEPRRFCRYLVGALAEVVPAVAETELAGAAAGPEFDRRTWTEDLALFLQELSPSRLRLVLDNFEAVAGAPAVVRLVEDLLRRSGDHLGLLVTSRTPPGLRLGRRLAGGTALLLEAGDLAMSLDEFRDAASRRAGRGEAARVEERWARSAGWCVAVGLGNEGGNDGKSDYLEEEILSALPVDLRDLLEAASLLAVIEPDGLEVLGYGTVDPAALGAALTAAGVPHFPVEDPAGIRLHPLVRERLLDRYRRRHPRREAGDPADRVFRWLRGEKRLDEAIRLRLDLEDREGMLEAITEDWAELEAQDLLSRADAWLRLVPESLHRHPFYVISRVRCLRFNGENRELTGYVERMRRSGVLAADHPMAAEIWASDLWARTHLALRPEYDRLRRQWEEIEPGADARSRLHAQYALAVAALYELRFAESREHVDAATRLAAGTSVSQEANAANATAVVLHEIGKSGDALALFDKHIDRCKREGEVTALTLNLIGKANVCKDVGRFKDAVTLADEALQTARAAGASRLVLLPHAARIRGEAFWHLGRTGPAMAELERAHAAFEDHNRYEALATGVLLDHWSRLSGKHAYHVTARDFEGTPTCEAHVRYLIRVGRELAEGDRHTEALAALDRARDLVRDMPFWAAAVRFTEAWTRYRREPGAEADAALREGLDLLERLDRSVYGMADPALNAWIAAGAVALDHGAERALAMVTGDRAVDLADAFGHRLLHESGAGRKRLLAAAARLGVRGLEEAAAGLPGLTDAGRKAYRDAVSRVPLPPLTVRLLGPLEVVVLGRPVQFSRRASRSVLEVLILEHPRPVHEEQLLEFLWPDADPGKAKHSLQTAVNDLRRALDAHHRPRQASYVQYREESYGLDLPPGSFVDLERFRSGLEELLRGKATPETGSTRVNRLRELLALYRGDLLADAAYAEHAGEPRERVRSLMLEGVAALARALEPDAGDEAVAVLRRGLEADPYWGEGVGLLMGCLERRGRVLAAIRVYREYERRLREDLGLAPEAPLVRRFRNLTAADAASR